MKTASAALKALLFDAQQNALTQLIFADLWTITLVTGTVYRYTSGDGNLTYGGNTFLADDLQIARAAIKSTTGLEVATLDLKVTPDPAGAATISGVPALQAIAQGDLDGATVRLERAFMPAYGTTTPGTVVLFVGIVTEISNVGRSSADLTVSSMLYLLNVPLPRNLIQPGCRWTLFDAGCTLSKAAYAVNGAVAAGSNQVTIKSGLTQADQYFQLGTINFTSGVNNGLSRGVRSYLNAGGAVTLNLGVPTVPSVGDTFTIYPGCDKQQSTCSGKFANLINFGGMPFVPTPETIL